MDKRWVDKLTDQVLSGERITRVQATQLAALDPSWDLELFRGASRLREHRFGRKVRCCSIGAAKVGRCSEDCAFCSQSAHYETHVQGLTVLPQDRVYDAAMEAAGNGAESFGIVNSGLGPTDREIEQWGQTVQRIRQQGSVRACASLGILEDGQARRLAELGVQRYNHNLQTSRRHFPNIITTHSYDDRLATLKHLKQAGISVCSGGLFGMGENWSDRIDLAFELQALDPDVVPINFLIPIDGTPLQGTDPLSPMECLRIIAIFRFILPRQDLKVAGGREVQLRDMQSWIFHAGASSFLIGNYLTTCGRSAEQDLQMVRDLGLEIETYTETAHETAGCGVSMDRCSA